jgi:hypothetical protein
MIPGAIVVGSDIPHAPPGCVVVTVDIEEAKRNPHGRIETEILRVEEERRPRYHVGCRRGVAQANVDVCPDPDVT